MAKLSRLLFLLVNLAHIVLSFKLGDFTKSIHIAPHLRDKYVTDNSLRLSIDGLERDKAVKKIPTFLQETLDKLQGTRKRRAIYDPDSTGSTGIGGLKPNSSMYVFNDSHSQMVVHWAGKDSNVIIALTKGSVIGVSALLPQRHSSNVFISHNYGRNFMSINNKLKLTNGSQAIISQFFTSPVLNSRYMLTDEDHNYIFATRDYGTTLFKQNVQFRPKTIRFHHTDYDLALAMDDSSIGDGVLYLTSNFGESWRVLQRGVRAFYWEHSKYGMNSSCIYILRQSSLDLGTVLRSCDFFQTEFELLSLVHDFEIQGPYMFATRKQRLLGGTGIAHQIYVSYYRGPFYNAEFPHELTHLDYYVADASEDQIFLCIDHGNQTTHLYISNVNGTRFSLSLDDILYFNPNGSNANSWLKYYMDEPFADLHKVEGMRGVYIATQLINHTLSVDHQRTLISFDKGAVWQMVVAPERDVFNKPTNCTERSNCSLHLTQTFDRLYASSRASPILSKESAPGIIMATGNYGSRIHIDDSAGVFVSADAGYTWHQVLQGIHFYAVADHGGIIVAVQHFEPTNQIVYSTDEGETWHTYNFTTTPIRIHGLLTEPGEKTTVFFLFGSQVDHHSWRVVSLNMSTVFNYRCSDSDYKDWSLPYDPQTQGCLLGRKVVIERRIPHTNCYNGKDYVRETNVRNCTCTRDDYECDFGYKPDGLFYSTQCITDPDMDVDVHEMPRPCPEGTFYPYTRGYAKISGDTCQGGDEHMFEPFSYACRVQNVEEFMLYSTRQAVTRHRFSAYDQDITLLTSTVAKNVSAVDYQLGAKGCLYWADNELHKIQRLCEDGNHTIEDLHYSRLGEVSSLTYDWKGLNIYWIDRQYRTIEVSKRNGDFRRMLINGTILESPHSLALDPDHGWMYWSEQGKIQKAWMDGTHSSVATLIDHPTVGLFSTITIDYMTEKVYWSGDSINSVFMSGSGFRTVHDGLARSIAIYKDKIYWVEDSWSNGIHLCDKVYCNLDETIHTDVSVIDLKILDENSQRIAGGNTACNQNGGCSQLCLLKPPEKAFNGRNRTCRCGNNDTRSVWSPGTSEDEHCCDHGVATTTGQCNTPNTTCLEDQFACNNGRCIYTLWMCDRDNDCGDGSDEQDCEYELCSDDKVSCDNGRCIPQTWHCDWDNDCRDGSDETGCTYPTCAADKFKCSNGRCINKSWRCDFDEDCPDGSDEENCPTNGTSCEENEFVCTTGSPHCILRSYVCDGTNQCYDRSDEANCNVTTCPSYKRSCGDGNCVYRSWWCDGDEDCINGSDEVNCNSTTVRPRTTTTTARSTTCRSNQFRCNNGICISYQVHCDGVNDCGDHSDEDRCGGSTVKPTTCSSQQYACANGRCVAGWMRCNRQNDCGDYSDEAYCGVTTPPVIDCWGGQFLCYNSSSRMCIDQSNRCDGTSDCQNGEDELGCGDATCHSDRFFKCRHSEGCIPIKSFCNEEIDCPDGSDESSCNQTGLVPSNTTCEDKYFQCKYENKCIPYMFVCDSQHHCLHKSDENLRQCFDSGLPDKQLYIKMGATNATVSWSPVRQSNATYIFSYMSFFHQAYTPINISLQGKTNYTVTKLHPAMTYYMTVYVMEGRNHTRKYRVMTVTTSDDVPEAPASVSLTSISDSNTIQVWWYSPRPFKGTITHYEVCIGPTATSINFCLPSKTRSLTIESIHAEAFKTGAKYFVQVSAFTSVGEGKKSAPANVTFGVDGVTSYVGDLAVKAIGNNSVKLSWVVPTTNLDKIDNYVIKYYDLWGNVNSTVVDKSERSFLVGNLCSGSRYTFSVAGSSKTTGIGPAIYINAKTNGTEIQPPTNITVELIEPTTVKVYWDLPVGANPSENFMVFYDYLPTDMHSHKLLTDANYQFTNSTVAYISGLRACDVYFFRIAVTGTGRCSASPIKTAQTSADLKAAPEDLKFYALNRTSGNLTWQAPCLEIEPTGYVVFREDVLTKVVVQTQPYRKTNATELSLFYRTLTPGASYTFSVMNTNKGAKMSEAINVTMAPNGEPINMYVKQSGEQGMIVWNAPFNRYPKAKFTGYEVLHCSQSESFQIGKCADVTAYIHYANTNTTNVNFSALPQGFHFFRVRLNKIDGYYGNLSVPAEIPILSEPTPTSNPLLPLNNTNLIAIAVSVAVVITCLVVIIGCFVVRHRRLKRSFHSFASSHYDSQSGLTTFSAAEELDEDEDAPMIRGFSDDEPLVIA